MIITILVILFLIFSFIGILSYLFEKPEKNNRTINITVNINIEDDEKDEGVSQQVTESISKDVPITPIETKDM